ncbi:MAG: ribbon-helix-helix protein, CopG family [Saprospiraceae bacterium]|nr:ribbon-helix-helix protein, CopG family [Saprospiraceae bacterium]
MKSITIYKLDDKLADKLEQLSKDMGLSQNKIIKKLLYQALNMDEEPAPKRDLSCVMGSWSQPEFDEFESSLSAFKEIDEDLWR